MHLSASWRASFFSLVAAGAGEQCDQPDEGRDLRTLGRLVRVPGTGTGRVRYGSVLEGWKMLEDVMWLDPERGCEWLVSAKEKAQGDGSGTTFSKHLMIHSKRFHR